MTKQDYNADAWWKKTSPDKWKLGVFYFNKEDKRLFIWGRKLGIGWTVNFANPFAIIVIIVLLLPVVWVVIAG